MNIEEFRNYCLAKKGVTEHLPFDENTLVFKVLGKMFALCDINKFESFNVKCNPTLAIELREKYQAVSPGYHMSKIHWNTILSNDDMDEIEQKKWIDHSYDLVVKGLPKKLQAELW